MGRVIERLNQVDSTNDYLKRRLASGNIDEGYTVLAAEQTGGKGRLNRVLENKIPPKVEKILIHL